VVREIDPSTAVYFLPTDNMFTFAQHFSPEIDNTIRPEDLLAAADRLSSADVIGFSLMTAASKYVEELTALIRARNPKCFIIWGGAHPTLNPNESIKHADAICVGEGEKPMREFAKGLAAGEIRRDIGNMWFRDGEKVVKNARFALNSGDELGSFPYAFNSNDCEVYDSRVKKFKKLTNPDYAYFNGLGFRTIWSLGCPFDCTYCSNDSFVRIDPGYRKMRHAPVDYIIGEIAHVKRNYPFISTVVFYDDNFISMPLEVISDFCEKYKKLVNIPFVVFGMHPNLITQEKFELLAKAGMNRARMGIQSGSEATLKFFKRNTTMAKIEASADIMIVNSRKYGLIPPAFDIISDNLNETPQDRVDTIELLYRFKRPFTLSVHALRLFPKTQLYDEVIKDPVLFAKYKLTPYLDTARTANNIALYLLAVMKPPRFVVDRLVDMIKRDVNNSVEHKAVFNIVKIIYLMNRAFSHVFKWDFSNIVGRWTYYLWVLSHLPEALAMGKGESK
jgi:radical SAM superfamily enzyme YgiQ (UPF0313 family)